MVIFNRLLPAMAGICLLAATSFSQQDNSAETNRQTEPLPPPELTAVSGRLMVSQDEGTTGGIAYFIYQRRLIEIPHDNALEHVQDMAEAAVAIDAGGSFTLNMAPGNYALVYDPNGVTSGTEEIPPGPDSQAAAQRRLTPDEIRERIKIIRDNAQNGLAVVNGKIGSAYVIENRGIRPPVTEFGEMLLGEDHSVTVIANGENGKPIDFPASLRLRGKSGDIYEPHSPSVSEPGVYHFYDVFPQPYEVFGLATKPKEGAGDTATTPTVSNALFVFEGKPMEVKVTVKQGSEDKDEEQAAPPDGAQKPDTSEAQ
jgi:hypothetical protein